MEWLKEYAKEFVSEDKMESFVEGFTKEFPKHAALKSDFNKRGEEIESLTNQLNTVNSQLTELKEKGNPNDEMKLALDKLTTELETEKLNAKKREEQWEMKEQYKKALSKNFNEDAVDLLMQSTDFDSMTRNEAGDIVDLESKIGKLKEARPTLVREYKAAAPKPDDKNPVNEPDFSKMTDAEYYAYKAQHKEE